MAMLSALAEQRQIFHSERDFQHALAWQIQLTYPQAHIRLEPRPRRGIHLDLLVRIGERSAAFELPRCAAQAADTRNPPFGHTSPPGCVPTPPTTTPVPTTISNA